MEIMQPPKHAVTGLTQSKQPSRQRYSAKKAGHKKRAPPSEVGPRRVDRRQSRAELSTAALLLLGGDLRGKSATMGKRRYGFGAASCTAIGFPYDCQAVEPQTERPPRGVSLKSDQVWGAHRKSATSFYHNA
jgi:hypothetical protein